MECEFPLKGLICDIYNRCSTTEEAQNKAIQIQAEESRQLVVKFGGCIYRQYIEQESGTSKKGRKNYAKLLDDIKSQSIDCVVIKSIDRLMRNASDWHEFVGMITKHKVKLFLYLERKFYEPEDAFLSGIKALIAEQYSRELSQKVNNAHRRRQHLENGNLTINSLVYGYTKCADKYIICEEEAAFIRKIFALSAAGIGSKKIADELAAMGISGRNGNAISACTIRRIIKNPLYLGTAVENKSHYDFEMKKTVATDSSEWIYHNNRVPRIVDENIWKMANEEMKKRSHGTWHKTKDELSGMFLCGSCNALFVRKKCGNTQCYRCKNKNNGQMCENSQAVYPQEFYETFLGVHKMEYELIKKEWNQAQTKFLELLNGIISDINGRYTEDYRQQQESLKNKRQRILEKFADGIITDEDYKSMREILDKKEKQLVKDIRKIQHSMETDRVRGIEELICREDFCRQLFFMYTMSEIEKIIVQKDALQIIYVDKPKEILIYKHKNQKTLKKEEKREEVYQCIKGGMGTASEIAEKTGLSAGNVLLKMKELKNQERVVFDGGWKILK